MAQGQNKIKVSEACDSETSNIDTVDDEPLDGMAIEEYILISVNNCDKQKKKREFTNREEKEGSVLSDNTWNSNSYGEDGDL